MEDARPIREGAKSPSECALIKSLIVSGKGAARCREEKCRRRKQNGEPAKRIRGPVRRYGRECKKHGRKRFPQVGKSWMANSRKKGMWHGKYAKKRITNAAHGMKKRKLEPGDGTEGPGTNQWPKKG